MIELTAALSAANAAFSFLKLGVASRDDAKVSAAIGEMAGKLTDANLAALSMSEHLRGLESELHELTTELRQLKAGQRIRERYILREVRPGAYVYAFEPADGDRTPAHMQCQICFDSGKHSILRLSTSGEVYECGINREHRIGIVEPRASSY